MYSRSPVPKVLFSLCATGLLVVSAPGQAQTPQPKLNPDAVQEAQTNRPSSKQRPEEKLSEHDKSAVFKAPNAPHESPVLITQPDEGEVKGFEFYRDPLNSKKPMQTPEEITAEDKAMK